MQRGVIGAIGKTPLVELTRIWSSGDVRVLAKLEGNNPGGSVKDRPALYMIRSAMERGELSPDKEILEPTSGNTGIAMAMIARALGFPITLVMPACVSVERRAVLEAYGATLVLSPAEEATDGAIRLAHRMLSDDPDRYYMPNQYDNPDNPRAHIETTGPEIWEQTEGGVTHFVAGMGTSGTLMGTGSYLKSRNRRIEIVGVEPTLGHKLQGLKNMEEAIVPGIYCRHDLNAVITMPDEEAFEMARRLALDEGIFAGMSGGAAVAGAIRVAEKIAKGVIVTIIPDRGDRYLSTNLFRSVCAECRP